MRSLRPILLCTSALTLTTLLAGCGAGSRPSFAGSGSGSGIAAPSSATTPTVTSVAVQVNGTAPNRLQEVQFSEPMNPATINTQTFQITDASGKAVPGVVSYDANYYVASFQPTPALKPSASYTATITTGVASAQGAHLASNYTYAIKTRKMTDNSPTYVTATNPGMDAT
ncbi:MAG TPA: Ig-like domain-containing protein, partial [Acidobacteriaceae bacterium]|nr:Ig-like domain-containing protein [Acidobacteriaceae bacterium]